MIPRKRNGAGLTVVLGAATLGLAACGDAYWITGEVKGGGASSGSSGGATGSGGAGTPTPGTGGASGQPACKTDVLGAADACLEVGTLQKQASDACEGAGLVLNGYSPSNDCGSGRSHFLKYTCCGSEPPPPPSPSECTSGSVVKADVCLDVGSLKKEADSACAGAGADMVVTGITPYEECGFGLYHSLKYTCCVREPSPSECTSGSVVKADVCLDVGSLKKEADSACAGGGADLVVTGVTPYEECGFGLYHSLKYTCCGREPPPPTECETKVQGDATSCKPAAVWEKYASEDCAAAGGKLNGFSPNEDCGDGNTRYVKYTCCGIAPPPPPPPIQCTTQVQGGDKGCQPAAFWKDYASEACVAAGGTLMAYSPNQDCDKGDSRSVKFTCCPTAATPPPAGK